MERISLHSLSGDHDDAQAVLQFEAELLQTLGILDRGIYIMDRARADAGTSPDHS